MSDTNVKTIAVFDMETSVLPESQNNACAIIELSIYAFPVKYLCAQTIGDIPTTLKPNEGMDGIDNIDKGPPDLPRVLQKLTIMINSERYINPISTKLSGLTYALLLNDASFDLNTANCLQSFLEHLEDPICLVAHNGWKFDYPVIRYVLAQISEILPSMIFCIDSLQAFRELDEKQDILQAINMSVFEKEQNDNMPSLNEYCTVFSEPFEPKEMHPKKDTYVLGNVFKRIFKQSPGKMLCAESEVAILTKIIMSYGLPFLAYIEQRKESSGKYRKQNC